MNPSELPSRIEAPDFIKTSPRVETIARALCKADGIDPDMRLPLVPNRILVYNEAKQNAYPAVMYGPRWMNFRREAFQMEEVLKAVGLLEEPRRPGQPRRRSRKSNLYDRQPRRL